MMSQEYYWLQEQAAAWNVTLSEETLTKLDSYSRLLRLWNERINLTAIIEPREIVCKHFLDSLSLTPLLPQGCLLIDIGTGAGFPGLPLKLARPDVDLTLLDSQQKRLHFLETVCQAAGVEATRIHARAETAARLPVLREQFDVATARAVASLPVLCEYCLPFVRVGGRFIAMKGPEGEQEAKEAQAAVAKLGAMLVEIRSFALPDNGGSRRLIVYEKTDTTPAEYPRPTAKIAKKPLK